MDIGSFISNLSLWLKNVLGPWAEPPLAAITIFVLSIAIPLLSSLSLRLFIDINRYKRLQRELAKLQQELRKAKDQKARGKIMRKMNAIQKEISKPTMINMFVTWPVIIILYYVFYGVFGDIGIVYLPLLDIKLNFFWWYFLSAIGMGTVIQKALGMVPP